MTQDESKVFHRTSDEAARLGHPSYVWRAGQERRLALVRQWARLDGAAILDAGCGVGMYTEQFRRFSPHVTGVEVDPAVASQAAARLPGIVLAPAEALPFADGSFDVVFSHEVIEHVTDDTAAAAEMARVLAPGGRIVMFCPNRLYPFRDPRPLLARNVSLRQHAADQLAAESAAEPAGPPCARLHRRGAARHLPGSAGGGHPSQRDLPRLRQHCGTAARHGSRAEAGALRAGAHPAAVVRVESLSGSRAVDWLVGLMYHDPR